MLLLVAVVRPAEEGSRPWRAADDRYVSARHMAALKTFEVAIVERAGAAPLEPSADELVARLPGCSREWGVSWRERWSARWRGGPPPVPPAAHIADQLG